MKRYGIAVSLSALLVVTGCSTAWYQAHKNVINGGIAGAASGAALAGTGGAAVGMPVGAVVWEWLFGKPIPPPAPAGKVLAPMKQSEK